MSLPETIWQCDDCGKRFTDCFDLEDHQKETQHKNYGFECTCCWDSTETEKGRRN